MRFSKVLLFSSLLMGLPSSVLADDLWGTSNSDSAEIDVDNDLWGSAAPAKKKKPAAQPAATPAPKAETPKPAPKPAAQPVSQPVSQPVLQPTPVRPAQPVEPAPAPVAEPVVQAEPVVPVDTASTVEPSIDTAATVAPDTTNEFATGFLTEAVDSSAADSVPAPVAVTDSVKKDSVVAPVAKVDSAKVDTAKKDTTANVPVAKADSAKKGSIGSNVILGFGVVADGAFGLFNQKLKSNSFLDPTFGAGITFLVGYTNFALRLEGQFKYETVYVNEDIGAINESCMRLGGGAFLRYTSGIQTGFVAEVGASFYAALSDDVLLYKNKDYTWALKYDSEIPLEVALGYKFPVSVIMLETDVFGSYDINEPVDFAFGRSIKGRAWHAGLRLIGWVL